MVKKQCNFFRYPCKRFVCVDNKTSRPVFADTETTTSIPSNDESMMSLLETTTKIDVTELVDYLKTEIMAAKNE